MGATPKKLAKNQTRPNVIKKTDKIAIVLRKDVVRT
jgi:hypothetical protein